MSIAIEYTADEREAHARRITRCKSCGSSIIWFKTLSGKNMPVNAETVLPLHTELDLRAMTSHFATCQDHAKHRKPR